jgi:peptidyl-prolyl cis-trans isomerase C
MTLEVPKLVPDEERPAPEMMEACQSCGCGGGPAPSPPDPGPTFTEVRVNGITIDPDAIAAEMQHHPADNADAAWREAARSLAVRELLLQEAQRLGLTAEAEVDAAGRTETEQDALIAALLEDEVAPEEPDEAACRRYYDGHRDRFRLPDLFEASHVLIAPDGDSPEAWSEAGIEARRILREVRDDPAALAEAARQLSDCPSAQQHGSLGQLRRADLVPEFRAALETLSPGETAPNPVRSRHGWHVLHLARRIEGETLPFEAAREKIADMLAARSWAMGAARYVATLAARSELVGVTIDAEVAP